jgi:hypothetical protein
MFSKQQPKAFGQPFQSGMTPSRTMNDCRQFISHQQHGN